MKPSDTDVETTLMVQPPDTNRHGTAFGGWIMAQMDLIAAICTTKYTGDGNCVTVCVDDIQFNKPIFMGDIVTMKARVNWTGNTSLEVGVKVFAETAGSTFRHCLSGYLTFVQLKDGKPWPVLAVEPETEQEKLRWNDAEQRRKDRLARRRK